MTKYVALFIGLFVLGCSVKDKKKVNLSAVFSTNEQEFRINNEKDTIITGQYGTTIRIPKHCLNTTHRDSIRFALKEVYTKSDMIKAGLSTTSNNKILESNGMVFIQAFHNETELVLNDKPIEITFAGNIDSDDYRVFYGDVRNQSVNWLVDTTTSNYHILMNYVLSGNYEPIDLKCKFCPDIGYDITQRIDSLRWSKGYTRIDTIVTFTGSNDTLPLSFIGQIDTASSISRDRVIDKIFKASKLQWINCDRFIDFQEFTTVHLAANKIQNPYVLCVFHDYNSIVQSDSQNNIDGVPVGEKVSIIGIDFKGDDIYFGMVSNLKITKDMTVNLQMEKTDKEIVDRVLKRLDN